ncbi:hypothetical protein HCU64_06360 [Methylobacterium sp. C25]|uniref:hypothetical protein n=1 Tax=Methylobacterium sp. C25 TaxID=2721622 RepID=UPI001F3F4B28|nr:hypothetical protein [Methylobacterium sp. C25]MCE4223368.1 hypothetical protein [Methylobacterium sp. C25]
MGWSLGYDPNWKRDVGYGVPAICDDPTCDAEIDRGLSYVCGGEPYGGEDGCGLHFCGNHLWHNKEGQQVCWRCRTGRKPYEPKPDTHEWLEWKLTDPSWAEWRKADPEEVRKIEAALEATPLPSPAQGGK